MSSKPESHEATIEVVPEPKSILAFVDTLLENEHFVHEPPRVVLHSYIGIALDETPYLLPLLACREVVRVGEITRIPESPPGVCGLVSLRGRIVPLVDVRLCLGLTPTLLTHQSRQVIVDVSRRPLALLVDRVTGILKLSETDELPASREDPRCVLGRVKHDGIQKRILSVDHLVSMSSG